MRRKGVDEAWTALEEMQAQGLSTDKYTVSRMLMKTVGDGRSRQNTQRIYRGIALVERFIDSQPKDVDEVLFNALLDTCCRLKDLARVEATMRRMRELGVQPSPVTLGILVKTYGQAGNLEKVLQVWGEMEKQRGQANAVTYGCMIDACVRCGHLVKAVEIFKGMRAAGKHKNTILYTTLIKGYGLEKDVQRALELFREMPREGVPYNTITYNSILDACVKCNEMATAEGLLREMMAPGSPIEPDLITFSTLLKGYCQMADLDKALQVVEAIKGRGLKCDELVYNTLMDGCVKANDMAAGIGLFEEMVGQGLRPSAITSSILTRLYQRSGYDDDASEAVAQLYQHHGIERPCGGDNRRGGDGRGGAAGNRHPRRSPIPSPATSSSAGCLRRHNTDGSEATPLASPMQMSQPYLPLEAIRGSPMAPPLPVMSRDATPYSTASWTPAASPLPGASPYWATGMQGDMFAVPPSPQTGGCQQPMQPGFCGPTGQQMYQAQAQLPPFPFACAAMPGQQGGVIAVPVMSGGPSPVQGMSMMNQQAQGLQQQMQQQAGVQGQQSQYQQQHQQHQQQQQQNGAYFEFWPQGSPCPGTVPNFGMPPQHSQG